MIKWFLLFGNLVIEMIGFSFFLLCYNIKYVNVNVKCFLSSIATDSVLGMEGDLL